MQHVEFQRPSPDAIAVIRRGSTASITTVLREHGVENSWMDLKPLGGVTPWRRSVSDTMELTAIRCCAR